MHGTFINNNDNKNCNMFLIIMFEIIILPIVYSFSDIHIDNKQLTAVVA